MLNEKRLFARLLAKEDIVVVQSSTAKTASFNVVSRTITFPVYKHMEESNYDGFTCHEVGHALHTDDEVMKLSLRFGHSVVNVVEDLRINNLMKSEYKGISNIFAKHYGLLDDREFFGSYGFDSGLLDKINIANKLRVNLFQTPEEKAFWSKFSNIETYDELVEACEYVVDQYKNENETPEETETGGFSDDESEAEGEAASEIIVPEDDESESENDDSEDDEESNAGVETDEESEDEGESEAEGGETEDDSDEESEDESDEAGEADDESDDPEGKGDIDTGENGDSSDEESEDEEFDPDSITAETEEEFENALNENVADDTYEARRKEPYIIPRTKDMIDVTIPIKAIRVIDKDDLAHKRNTDSEWIEFNTYKKKTVNRMVSMFNRKKAASEYHRRKFSETGSLNMRKLHEYKTNDNIFLKNMKIAEGKNHGVVFYLDNSSSMRGAYGRYTTKQIAIMVDFCRKLSIPYTVLGYSYNETYIPYNKEKSATTIVNNRYDIELLTHTQSESEHNDHMFAIWKLFDRCSYRALEFTYNERNYPVKTYGTPLCASIINSIKYVDMFKKKNNVQIMNVMYFTDGDDSYNITTEGGYVARKYDATFVDAETKKKYNIDDYNNKAKQATSMLYANIVKDRMNCNVFFFRIPKYVTRIGHMFANVGWDDKSAMSKASRMLKKNTFYKVEEESGIEHYLLHTGSDDPEEADYSSVNVEADKSGKVSKKSINALKQQIKAANASRKGSYMFADLVAQKVAEGF